MSNTDDDISDAELMNRAKSGDTFAFERLVDRWKLPVFHFILRTLPDESEAEDLAQTAFVQVWRSAPRYRAEARFSTFLFTIARNLCLNEIRRRKRHPTESLSPAPSDDEESEFCPQFHDPKQRPAGIDAESSELTEKVQEALDALPENQRAALTLCRESELSYEEIADTLGVSLAATKSLIHRARESLKAHLKPYLKTGDWNLR